LERLYKLRDFLQQAHWISLDVTIGAIICNLVFLGLPNGQNNHTILISILLGIAVFLVYTSDRILDLKEDVLSDTKRHTFHLKHQKVLKEIIAIFGFFALLYSFTLPTQIIKLGLGIGFLVVFYLFFVNKLKPNHKAMVLKEPIIASIFTVGVVGPSICLDFQKSWQEWATIVMFLLIVMQNVVLFSMYENIAKPDTNNIAKYLGNGVSRTINTVLFLTILLLGSITFSQNHEDYLAKIILVQMIMASVLWLLNDFVKFFVQEERYRWLGDGVFLLLAAVLIL
jgi:hypothetical protein